jgi:hypothetical protein
MKNYNCDNLKLYSVNVSQQWTSEADAIIFANSLEEAEQIAVKHVDMDPKDDWCSKAETYGIEISLSKLNGLVFNPNLYYIAPTPQGETIFSSLNKFEEFKALISPEKIEELRRIEMEKNNGQLSMFTSSD